MRLILYHTLEWFLLFPLVAINSVFITEIIFGLRNDRETDHFDRENISIAILMPAHNEAETIHSTINQLAFLPHSSVRIVVVADNCHDQTAQIAKSSGCDVVIRNDELLKGKGFALDAGVEFLKNSPPDIVVILDADCGIDEFSLFKIANEAYKLDRPVQAAYLFKPDMAAHPLTQISNFAFYIKNVVRQRGAKTIGAAAILTGSGIAFPWRLIRTLNLATANIVEDLALGIELVQQGEYPYFDGCAKVWSDASTLSGTRVQRSRWESGFISTAVEKAIPLIYRGIKERDFKIFWMGMHLTVPPLSILIIIDFLYSIFGAIFFVSTQESLVFIVSLILMIVTLNATFAGWVVGGRSYTAPRVFLTLPIYFFGKMAMYLSFISRPGSVKWTRTERQKR